MPESWIGQTVDVVVEATAGSFVKRDAAGRVDVVSPLPVPWNYGSIPGSVAPDGDPVDVVVVGRPLPVGHRGSYVVHGVVDMVDAGQDDPKLVCGRDGVLIRGAVAAFFAVYVRYKRVLYRLRGRTGATVVRGIRWAPR